MCNDTFAGQDISSKPSKDIEHYCDNPLCDLYQYRYDGGNAFYINARTGLGQTKFTRDKYTNEKGKSIYLCNVCSNASNLIKEIFK